MKSVTILCGHYFSKMMVGVKVEGASRSHVSFRMCCEGVGRISTSVLIDSAQLLVLGGSFSTPHSEQV